MMQRVLIISLTTLQEIQGAFLNRVINGREVNTGAFTTTDYTVSAVLKPFDFANQGEGNPTINR